MKHIICMFIQLIFTINSGSAVGLKHVFSSPIGPYRLSFKQVYNCNPTHDNKIQFFMHVIQKDNITMLVGNTTGSLQFDDTFFLEARAGIKDSSGIWNENVFVYKSPNGCSKVKQILGKTWSTVMHGYGIQSANCPVLPGVYISPGLDLSIVEKANLPKTAIYGTFKCHIYFTKKNEMFGCQAFIVEVKRP